ncbi:MAG: hypothetical protein SF028_03515 [Candidatus Sumerlaeia bacterium]|nr:hypothetical protein [Candidatus Sumerlaeia bacterium]
MLMLCHKCQHRWDEDLLPGQNAVECPKCRTVLITDDFTGTVAFGSVLPQPKSVSREEILKVITTPVPAKRLEKAPETSGKPSAAPRRPDPRLKAQRSQPASKHDVAPRTEPPRGSRRSAQRPDPVPDTHSTATPFHLRSPLSNMETRVHYPEKTRLEQISPIIVGRPKVGADPGAADTREGAPSLSPITAFMPEETPLDLSAMKTTIERRETPKSKKNNPVDEAILDLSDMKTTIEPRPAADRPPPLRSLLDELTPLEPGRSAEKSTSTAPPARQGGLSSHALRTLVLEGPPPGMIESLLENVGPDSPNPKSRRK